jgi:hypothetical protein
MSGHDAKYFTTTKKGEIHELKEELNSQYKVPNQKLNPVAAMLFFSTSPPHFFSTPSYSVFVFLCFCPVWFLDLFGCMVVDSLFYVTACEDLLLGFYVVLCVCVCVCFLGPFFFFLWILLREMRIYSG